VIRREIRCMMVFDTGWEQSGAQSVVTADSTFGYKSGSTIGCDAEMIARCGLPGGNPCGT